MPWHARRHSAVSCAKMDEQVEMSFGLWTRVGPKKHVLYGVHIGAMNHPCAAVMRPFCQITLTTYCYYYYAALRYCIRILHTLIPSV